jgi:hypothetical protein
MKIWILKQNLHNKVADFIVQNEKILIAYDNNYKRVKELEEE